MNINLTNKVKDQLIHLVGEADTTLLENLVINTYLRDKIFRFIVPAEFFIICCEADQEGNICMYKLV